MDKLKKLSYLPADVVKKLDTKLSHFPVEEIKKLKWLLRQHIDEFTKLSDFPAEERNKLKWLLRQHGDEMVEAGIAHKFGRDWEINRPKLPDFLRQLTLRALRARRSA